MFFSNFTMKKLWFFFLSLLFGWSSASGQIPTVERIAADPRIAMFDLALYPEAKIRTQTPAPEGYVPFYIAHYGRHGSRLCSLESDYTLLISMLEQAESRGTLTPTGRRLLHDLRLVYAEARGRSGELTPTGEAQHRGIARRMTANYPGLFRRGASVECLSSTATRCILSMTAFCEELKALQPGLEITHEASPRTMPKVYAFCESDRLRLFDSLVRRSALYKELTREPGKAFIRPERLLGSLMTDPEALSDARQVAFTRLLYKVANSLAGSTFSSLSFYPLFTPEELYAQWKYANYKVYLICGPSAQFGKWMNCLVSPVLENMLDSAEHAVAAEGPVASLRFGHDNTLMALGGLLQIEGLSFVSDNRDEVSAHWSTSDYTPAAANLQLVFYRNGKGHVLVKIRWNENEVRIPLPADHYPYYEWTALKNYCRGRIEAAEAICR